MDTSTTAQAPAAAVSAPGSGKRSRTGCLTCRSRRVKCGEQRPECQTCARLKITCEWDDDQGRAVSKRPRPIKSCEQCRSRKTRCTGPTSTGDCERCIAAGLDCLWAQPQRAHRHSTAASSSVHDDSFWEPPVEIHMGSQVDEGRQSPPESSARVSLSHGSLHDIHETALGGIREPLGGLLNRSRSTPGFLHHHHHHQPTLSHERMSMSMTDNRNGHVNVNVPDVHFSPAAASSHSVVDHAHTVSSISWSADPPSLPDNPRFGQLLDKYFETVHHTGFLTFIHPLHFAILLKKGKVMRELPLLMAACTARYGAHPPDPADLELADTWADSAIQSLLPSIYRSFGAEQLMAVMLAQTYEINRGNFTSGWLLAGNATRMMQMLQLHTYDETYGQARLVNVSPLLQPEALRRLAWSVFWLDAIIDRGRYGVHTLTEDIFTVQLPANEHEFLSDSVVTTEQLRQTTAATPAAAAAASSSGSGLGLSAWLIRTAAARRRILHQSSRIKMSPKTADELEPEVGALQADLDSVIRALPRRLQYSSDNLVLHRDSLPAFILLHTLRHEVYMCMARARLYVVSRRPGGLDGPEATRCRHDRVARAIPMARIIAEGLERGVIFDSLVGIVAYVALEILLLEPPRLARHDPSIDPKSHLYTEAMTPLLTLIRLMGTASKWKGRLHVEACYRLVCLGFSDLMNEEDWTAFRRDYHLIKPTDSEFDFGDFHWARIERSTGRSETLVNAAGFLLDVGIRTAAPSAAPSPRAYELDAGFSMSREDDEDNAAVNGSTAAGIAGGVGGTGAVAGLATALGAGDMGPGSVDILGGVGVGVEGNSSDPAGLPQFDRLVANDPWSFLEVSDDIFGWITQQSTDGAFQLI